MPAITMRPGESAKSYRRRQSIANAVQRHGLRVECPTCGWLGRHRPWEDGRLRDARCPSTVCEGRSKLRRRYGR